MYDLNLLELFVVAVALVGAVVVQAFIWAAEDRLTTSHGKRNLVD